MGLDATVRCRCFEEGKLKPGPVPADDLFIDEEGYLSSRKLDEAYKKYGYRRFQARYGALEDEFLQWSNHCCEHEFGDYCSEWVSNWSGCGEFSSLVEELGGMEKFPLLSTLLPDSNGGIYPAEKAQKTLEELDRFIEVVVDADQWVLRDVETETEVWSTTGDSTSSWMIGPFDKVGMTGGEVYIAHAGNQTVKTTHFKQIPIGESDNRGYQRMRIVCLDTGEETETFDSIGPEGSDKVEREFFVASEKAPFLYEGKYWTAERIRHLLVASIETGNPIRWC